MTNNSEYMTIKQAAAYTDMSPQSFYVWARAKVLKRYKDTLPKQGGTRKKPFLYKKSDIDAAMAQDRFVEVE